MRTNSPGAFFTSLTLHGVVAGLIIFFTYYASHHQSEAPVIFELVAGPPTAPDELVAPALGNTRNPVKLDVPTPPEVAPEPPVTETVKTVETPPVKEEVVPPPPKPEAKPVPAKKPTPPPPKEKTMAQEMKQAQRTSYKDYLKKNPIKKQTAQAPKTSGKPVPRIDSQGIASGVRGGSTANTRGGGGGKAMTREEQSALNTYYSLIKTALKNAHEPPQGASDALEVIVTFDLTASGIMLNPRVTKSSGNAEFDQSVLDAFRKVGTVGAPPNKKSDTLSLTFKMRDD